MTNGPRITVKLSCFDCKHESSENYQVQGDSGHKVFCTHPAVAKQPRRIGDTDWSTPMWCPFLNGAKP